MAEEIVLSGQFRDNITPQLKKLSRELNNVSKSFTKIQKKLRPITKEMGTLAMASERVANALKAQKSIIDQNARSWSNYKTEVGRAGAAQRRAFQGAPRGGTPAPRIPRTVPGAAPPAGGTGPGAAAVAGGVLGVTLSNIITNAVVSGFQLGSKIIMEPFRFLINGLGERIQDEMSDVRAAGGLFAISRRMEGGGFVNNFAEAEALTKEQNRYLAKLAGALPGDTQQYIQVAKQISDGIYTVIAQDRDNAIALGQELARGRGADLAKFEQGGIEAMQAAGKEIVGEMTKLTVLAGLGGQQGAFGLPQLTEQMISRDEVTLGQFQRYAAIFRDPMIKGALERNIENINAAGKNTTARLEAIRKTFQEVVTPELVRRYQRTTSGTLEALRTTFLNPEVGLLGLGRPLSIMAKTFDEFGNVVEKNGKVVEEALSIFDYLRDIFANLMIVLQPVIDAAVNLFDPFIDLGNQLNRLREATMLFQNSFERYRKGLQNIANGLEGEAKTTFESTLTLRASLAAINNAFANLGVYGDKDFQELAEILKDPTAGMAEFQQIIRDMVTRFLNSEGAKKIGEAIGGIIGTVVSTVGNMLAQIAGIATAGPLAEGFNEGFEAAGGKEGIKNIIKSVFELIGKAIVEVFKMAPFEVSLVSGLVLFGPAIAAALGTALVGAVSKMGSRLVFGRGLAPAMQGSGQAAPAAQRPARLGATPFVTRRGAATARLARMRGKGAMTGMVQAAKQTKAVTQLAKAMATVSKAAGPVAKFAKAIPGGAVAIGALDAGLRIAAGEDAGKAIGGAASSAIGATLGGILGQAIIPIPGVGAALGAVAGGFIGDHVFSMLAGPTDEQSTAAQLQMQAAEQQKQAADMRAAGLDVTDGAFRFGAAEEFQQRIHELGLGLDPTVHAFTQLYVQNEANIAKAKEAGEALNAEIVRLRNLGVPQAEIADRVRGLQTTYNTAKQETQTTLEALQASWRELGPKTSEAILSSFKNMPVGAVEEAIAQKIREINARNTMPSSGRGEGRAAFTDSNASAGETAASYNGNFDTPLGRQLKKVGFAYNGSLGSAITTEMKHKPPGSNLVIANSSETIIPAYKGLVPDISPVVSAFTGYSSGEIQTLEMTPTQKSDKSRGDINMGGVTVNVSGVNDPENIAEQVADQLLVAMRKASYSELDLT